MWGYKISLVVVLVIVVFLSSREVREFFKDMWETFMKR